MNFLKKIKYNKIVSGKIKKNKVAINLYKLANSGHSDSAFLLGIYYKKGVFVPKHIPSALKWLHHAIKLGNKKAFFEISSILYYEYICDIENGIFPRDFCWKKAHSSLALNYALSGLNLGDIESANLAVKILIKTDGMRSQFTIDTIKNASRLGDSFSQSVCAHESYNNNTEFFIDGMSRLESASFWISEALGKSNLEPYSYFIAALLTLNGVIPGGEKMYQVLIKKSADLGHSEASYHYGSKLLSQGDDVNGILYLKKSYLKGNHDSAFILGNFYLNNKIILESIQWHIRSYRLGNSKSLEILNKMKNTRILEFEKYLINYLLKNKNSLSL